MPRVVKFPCIPAQQGAHKMFVFCADAKTLWGILKINRRKEDKDEGYQRALSPARVKQIARYYDSGKAIPGALIVAFDKAKIEDGGKTIAITNDDDAGWVIDGQHRLAGAHESTSGSIGTSGRRVR
jgi:DGQHR domain-containing protein